MSDNKQEYGTINIYDLLTTWNLEIPSYQRPYKWTDKNIFTLMDDLADIVKKVDEAKGNTDHTYRIGTVILHKEKKGDHEWKYNIVDGQQRLLSIVLLLCCLEGKSGCLFRRRRTYMD